MAPGAATILHADLDSFYASVEVRNHPALRGLPVAVGGGVVLAATYEAKRAGVTSGMGTTAARRLCPQLIVVEGHFTEYVAVSSTVMTILGDFTPLVEQISIDEAFLDVTGTVHLLGEPEAIASAIRARVRAETGLAISVGIASTKFLAKVASRRAKPDGLVAVEPGTELAFLHPLPVEALWGVGPVVAERLARYGIATVGDLAGAGDTALRTWLGPATGGHLWALAHNRDPRPVRPGRSARSIGAQSAFGPRGSDPHLRRRVILGLAERVGSRLRRSGLGARRMTVRARLRGTTSMTRSRALAGPLSATSPIFHAALPLSDALAAEAARRGATIDLLAISLTVLEPVPVVQLELPMSPLDGDAIVRPGSPLGVRHTDLDRAIDGARRRFGVDAVRRAGLPERVRRFLDPDDWYGRPSPSALPLSPRRLEPSVEEESAWDGRAEP